MFYPAAGGTSEVRFVSDISTNQVSLDSNLSAAGSYTAGAKVAGGFNYEPVLGSYAKKLYINAEMGSHSVLLGPGAITGLKLQGLAAKAGLRWVFDYMGDQYAAGFTPSAYTYNAYGSTSCLVAKGAPCTIDDTDTNVLELSVDFGCKHEEITATSGTNGRAGWELTECSEPTIEFTEYYNATRWTKYASRATSEIRLVVPVSSVETARLGTVAIWMPAAQVTVEDVVVNGQRAQKVKAVGRRPTAAQKVSGVDKPIFMTVFGGI
jgi:hypothetical protein